MRHIVALSGGKDSTALALRLAETQPDTDFEYICTPTGNELPEMFAHWDRLEQLLGRPLRRLKADETLFSLIDHFQALPNNRMRWCTRILKIEPCLEYMAGAAPAKLYVGLRADEPTRRGGVYDDIGGIEQAFPLRDWGWGLPEVLRYLQDQGVRIPMRTDCALCYHQRLPEWWSLWKDHPEHWAKGVELEAQVSALRGKETTFRNATRDTWPASLAELAALFETGKIPPGLEFTGDLFGDELCRVCSL